MTPPVLAPSILAADFSRLGEEVAACEAAGVTRLHFDVMDGRFVPNISFGPAFITSVRGQSQVHFDTHLMIVEPERYVDAFVEAGSQTVTVHAEASTHLQRTLSHIRSLGAKAGVALNPSTPLTALDYVLADVDLILIMTVNPGFGGQKFIPAMMEKISRTRGLIQESGRSILLEVDGGIGPANAQAIRDAGADTFVAGTSVFGHAGGIAGGVAAMHRAWGMET